MDHPHIIPVQAGEADNVLYIAMCFVAGGDLRSVVEREGPLPPGRAADLISPVSSALDAAHGAGLVHRDVKLANILVDASPGRPDHVYLSDFGLTKGELSSASLTGPGHFIGTPDYSAPEQISGRAVDRLAKEPGTRFGGCGEFADALREALGVTPYGAHVADRQRTRTVVADQQPTPDSPPPGNVPAHRAAPTISVNAAVPMADATSPVPVRRQRARRIAMAGTGLAVAVAAAFIATMLVNPGAHGTPHKNIATTGGTSQRASAVGQHTTITLGSTLTDPSEVTSIAFTPDGKSLVTSDGVTYLWDIATGGSNSLSYIHNNGVDTATISPNGKLVAAVAHQSTSVYLWNAITRGYVTTLTIPSDDEASSVAFSPDGNLLATGDDNGGIAFWHINSRSLSRTLDLRARVADLSGVSVPGSLICPGLASL